MAFSHPQSLKPWIYAETFTFSDFSSCYQELSIDFPPNNHSLALSSQFCEDVFGYVDNSTYSNGLSPLHLLFSGGLKQFQ